MSFEDLLQEACKNYYGPGEWRDRVRYALDFHTVQWPNNEDAFIRDDMGQGQLRVMFDGDKDVIIAIWPEDGPSVSLEFCTSGNGGGKSPNVRAALIALMVAMEKDGATPWPAGAR